MIDFALIGFLVLGLNFGIGGVLNVYYNGKLFFYMKKNYYKIWKEQMLFPNAGIGMANPFKTLIYSFNNSNIKDKTIFKLKKRIKFWTIYTIISFILMLIWMILMVIIAAFQGRLV